MYWWTNRCKARPITPLIPHPTSVTVALELRTLCRQRKLFLSASHWATSGETLQSTAPVVPPDLSEFNRPGDCLIEIVWRPISSSSSSTLASTKPRLADGISCEKRSNVSAYHLVPAETIKANQYQSHPLRRHEPLPTPPPSG